ncbi:methyltransferase, FxLD system [Longispora sp. NPDC051575]|uniref:methyltransferase, FxLD system n=1 Tax=Longispora sp. NPDC051575 TaxID=3154943 RepID=UPI00341E85F7
MTDRIGKHLVDMGHELHPEVRRAFATVPREVFAPEATPEEAYTWNEAVVTKRRGAESTSSVSAPYLQAEMIGQAVDALGSLDGRHVLEIGSGGYNAALLRELVGASGSVTTVDIDAFVTDRASAFLTAAGYDDVTVVCADAELPIEPARRYDLILVTVGAWDVPSAWTDQLAEGGVLVVPLRTWGITRSWALRRDGDGLVSHSQRHCGFVSMQGDGASEVRYVDIADGVHLRLDEGQQVDAAAVAGLLGEPRQETWAGLSLPGGTVLGDLNLWVATQLAGRAEQFVVLTAQQEAIDAGRITPAWRFGTPAVLDGDTLSYLAKFRWTGDTFDLGVYAHGPDAAAAAERMVQIMRDWLAGGTPLLVLHVLPATTPDGALPAGTVLDKRHRRLVLAFTPA